jgi:hypothetical protein
MGNHSLMGYSGYSHMGYSGYSHMGYSASRLGGWAPDRRIGTAHTVGPKALERSREPLSARREGGAAESGTHRSFVMVLS